MVNTPSYFGVIASFTVSYITPLVWYAHFIFTVCGIVTTFHGGCQMIVQKSIAQVNVKVT